MHPRGCIIRSMVVCAEWQLALRRCAGVQVHNVAAASNAALQQDVKTLQEETEKLTAELEDVLEQFDGLQHEANQVEGEVVDEVSCPL